MPNWCYTHINIYNENKEENDVFNHLMKEWTSKNYIENGFGHNWLGNVVIGSGIGTVDTNPKTDIRCRGSISYWYYDENKTFTFETDTAWSPMLKMWFMLIEKYMPNAELIFSAEEPGCCLYDTNDPDLIGKYIVDVWDEIPIEIDDHIYDADKKCVEEILRELFNDETSSFRKLIKKFDESEFRDHMAIYKWEYADADTYC